MGKNSEKEHICVCMCVCVYTYIYLIYFAVHLKLTQLSKQLYSNKIDF